MTLDLQPIKDRVTKAEYFEYYKDDVAALIAEVEKLRLDNAHLKRHIEATQGKAMIDVAGIIYDKEMEIEKLREALGLAIDGIEECGCCCDRRLPEIKAVLNDQTD